MPEHFHLLIAEPEVGDPSVAMKVVKQRFARRVNRRGKQRSAGADDRSGIHAPDQSGRNASTISTCGASISGSRSCVTCTGTR